MSDTSQPLQSLASGNWFKLICGASFQHLPAIRNLALAYALAGADCVDVAADPAVIAAAKAGLAAAADLRAEATKLGFSPHHSSWLMVSLNDGEDPHFRKATFQVDRCPADCSRPCEWVCPTQAIVFDRWVNGDRLSGVIEQLCYGCGRCIPVCPVQNIAAQSYVFTPEAIAPLVLQGVDAVEIHTQVGRFEDFRRLWGAIASNAPQLKLIAVSCPDDPELIDYLWALSELMGSDPQAVVWQTDGRPMSGDIGDGATHAAIKLGQKVAAAGPPGYVQLAGGTNRYTVPKLQSLGLLNSTRTLPLIQSTARSIAGVAYGGYARSLLAPVLQQLEPAIAPWDQASLTDANQNSLGSQLGGIQAYNLESQPELLWQAVALASDLVSQLKPKSQPMLTHS
ncbi:circadian clock protein LdpA [Leptolyngbya sp. AN02str]|uniref:circadian clock protein LdpA n=1 Tax=Leptolyngbya sp. AN02str TaxID=3423363 RepID=UPI003D318A11